MTPRYLPVSTVSAQLGIGPRRLRTLLAAGRIPGAYRLYGGDPVLVQRHGLGPWLIPADYRVTPPPHLTGPARDWGKA